MKHTKEEIAEAKKRLLNILKPGSKIYTILRHRSSSGMSRVIDLIFIDAEYSGSLHHMEAKPNIYRIGYNVAIVLGLKWDNRDGIKVGGCGMDMGFHLVYSLGSALWGHGSEGDAVKQGYVTGRNGDTTPETDGGYLLKHSWL